MKLLESCIHLIDKFINLIIILCLILILSFGIYSLWDSKNMYEEAMALQYETYKPTLKDKMSFEELKKINPDVFGWLTIEGTNVDYPLVQSTNNSKYVNTNVKGEFALTGSIFLDSRNKNDFSDINNIIYGHNMEKNAMFGGLKDYAERDYFEKHKYGKLYYGESWHNVDFFAFAVVDAYDTMIYNPYLNYDEIQQYLVYIEQNAEQYFKLPFSRNDRFLILSTCTSTDTNGRHILVGRIAE